MRLFVLIVFVLTFFFVPHRLSAAMDSPPAINNPPVSTGTLFGNRGMYFQMLVNKKLQSAPRIGFFSVTSLVGEWDRQEISDLWRFFSRLQVLYGFNPRSGDHARSYLVARAGLNYREFTFGVGANIDYYGPVRRNENNIGVFLSVQLF